jgi:diguanylate cyclase (GGDEF)-like protein
LLCGDGNRSDGATVTRKTRRQSRTGARSRPAVASPALDATDIMMSVGEAAYAWGIDTDALQWGANAAEVLGLRDMTKVATGRSFAKLLDPRNAQTRYDAVMRSQGRDEGRGVPFQVQYCLGGGARSPKLWIEDTGRWFAGPDGCPSHVHGVIRSINARHEHEQQLAYLSRFDRLTGEINRWHLTELLDEVLHEAVRAQSSCGFMLVAINDLGRINEAYGYNVADEIIAAVARRLRSKMRAEDSLGRFSGNKFGMILKESTAEDMAVAAERLLAGIRDDVVTTSAGAVAVTATIGGLVAPRHAGSVQEILARAHETLDAAKARRPGSFLIYRPSVERDTMRRRNMQASEEIVDALNERRIALAYEPIAESRTRRTAFYECLMRVQRQDGTYAPAQEIVPLAERLGLMRMLDHRIFELVVAELKASADLKVSVNISPGSTTDPDWWAQLTMFLRANSGVAERLTLEITETAAIHDVDETRGFVARAKDLGARIAIDDFGAGHTSFRNLRKLGVDIVKIDGAFVQNMVHSDDDRAFVQTMIELSRRLRLQSVAEWVQDERAAALLSRWGCDYLQGSLVGLASADKPWSRTEAGEPAARPA